MSLTEMLSAFYGMRHDYTLPHINHRQSRIVSFSKWQKLIGIYKPVMLKINW